MEKIKAITFDLWDTIVHDDSDESKRKAAGLRSKRDERRHLVWSALHEERPIDEESVYLAYDVAEAAFNKTWKEQHVTWSIGERLDLVFAGLHRARPPGWDDVIRAHEKMEVEIPPDLIPGCREALEALSGKYKLAIVSDAIVSPGTALRQLLEDHGVKDFFSGFAFSDEVGHSKPHVAMFRSAAEQLGVAVDEMLHIGDRDHNDVKGPQALGMKAILFTATRDVDRKHTSADAVCASYSELPAAIDRLTAA